MLCTLAQVKARLGLPAEDVQDDELLTSLIGLVSARFEKECNRGFGYQEQSDEFNGDELELRVSRYPIDEAEDITFELKQNQTDGFEEITPDFNVRRGWLISLGVEQGRSRHALRVTYTGGYNLPDAVAVEPTAPDLPDDLREACVDQVVYLYQNKNRMGVASMSGQGGSIVMDAKSVVAPLTLLPQVLQVLRKYERWLV